MSARGTSNTNSRGSSYDRRRRREFLIEKFGSPSGKTIPCFHCKKLLHVDTKTRTWEIDRYPVCGHAGGTYVRDNVVPSCLDCNKSRCREGCRVGGAVRRKIGESTSVSPPRVVPAPLEGVTDTSLLYVDEPAPFPVPVEPIVDVPTGQLTLNYKERRVLGVLAAARRPLKLAELAPVAFPEETKRGNSWVRNSLRRLRAHGLARRFARGAYELAQLPIAVNS